MMKKIFAICVLTVFITSALTGCAVVNISNERVILGKGEVISRSFEVGRYSEVEVKGDFEIVYRNDTSDKITVEMQENLFDYFSASVTGEKLIIDTSAKLRTKNDNYPKITITAPELSKFVLKGATVIKDSDTIKADELSIIMSGACEIDTRIEVKSVNVDLSGAGNMKLKGVADSAQINMSGAGSLNALELETVNANVTISGAGGGSINCSGKLKVTISGVGSLKYKGNPALDKNISGVGSVNKVD